MKLPEPAYEALSTLYSPGAVDSARTRLRDTRKDLMRWEQEVGDVQSMRQTLRETAASCVPEVREFLETEADLCQTMLAQAEGKAATCARRIEELEAYLRRAAKVSAWI